MNLRKFALVSTIAICAVALAGCKKQAAVNQTVSSNTSASAGAAMSDLVITFDGTSFSPSSLKAKAGETITIKNGSSVIVQVNSDPHPTHTLYPELNLGAIGPGSSRTFTISKAGTYSYHNHLNASQKGTIVVQ